MTGSGLLRALKLVCMWCSYTDPSYLSSNERQQEDKTDFWTDFKIRAQGCTCTYTCVSGPLIRESKNIVTQRCSSLSDIQLLMFTNYRLLLWLGKSLSLYQCANISSHWTWEINSRCVCVPLSSVHFFLFARLGRTFFQRLDSTTIMIRSSGVWLQYQTVLWKSMCSW